MPDGVIKIRALPGHRGLGFRGLLGFGNRPVPACWVRAFIGDYSPTEICSRDTRGAQLLPCSELGVFWRHKPTRMKGFGEACQMGFLTEGVSLNPTTQTPPKPHIVTGCACFLVETVGAHTEGSWGILKESGLWSLMANP